MSTVVEAVQDGLGMIIKIAVHNQCAQSLVITSLSVMSIFGLA